jgi:hypothetical protein
VSTTVTDRGTTENEYSGGADSTTELDSGSFTPTEGNILVAIYGGVANNPGGGVLGLAISDTHASVGAWTEVEDVSTIFGFPNVQGFAYAVVGSSPGSGVVRLTRTPGGSLEWGAYLRVLELSSTEGTMEYVQDDFTVVQDEGSGGDTTPTVTLPVTPAATSVVVAGLVDQFGGPSLGVDDEDSGEIGPDYICGYDQTPPSTLTATGCGGAATVLFMAEFAEPESGGVTGTIAVTQDDNAMSASGSETIAGTIAVTQDNAVMAASGTVVNPAEETPYTPVPVVEFAFGYTGPYTAIPDEAWVDVSEFVYTAPPTRGRSNELTLFSAGTMQLQLETPERRFDPLNADGPYFGDLVVNTPVRVRASLLVDDEEVLFPIFYGYVDAWKYRPGTHISICTVPCTDAFKFLARRKLPQSVYETVVVADGPLLYWRLGEADGDTAPDSSGNHRDGTYAATGIERAQGSVLPYSSSSSLKMNADTVRAVRTSDGWTQSGSTPFIFECWVQAEVDAMDGSQDYHLAMQGSSDADDRWLVSYRQLSGAGELHFQHGGALAPANRNRYWYCPKLDDGRPHHVAVGVLADGGVYGYVDGTLLEVENNNSTQPPNIPAGMYVGGESDGYPSWVGNIAHLAIYNTGTITTLANAHYTVGAAPWAGDTTGQRYERVLDLIGWPAGLRSVDPGGVFVSVGPADLAGSTVLDYFQLLAQTEQGRHFVGAEGALTFTDAESTVTGVSAYTFDDDPEDGIIEEGSITFSLDETFLYEEAVVQRKYGAPQRALAAGVTDPVSSISLTGLLGLRDSQARSLAERLVFVYGTAKTRAEAWTVQPEQTPGAWADLLGLEIGDVVTLSVSPEGEGDPIEVTLFIEFISHVITAEDWTITFYGSPTDETNYFIIGGDGATQGIGTGVMR